MGYKINEYQKNRITGTNSSIDEAYDYDVTHDYNKIHLSFVVNNYKCFTMHDAIAQKKSGSEKIAMYNNKELCCLI